jgi:gas vesicle protein
MRAKSLLITVSVSVLAGMVVGILYAPTKGSETRDKIRRIKQKLGIGADDEVEDYDRDTLHELRISLQDQLRILDAALEKEAG